MIVKKAPAILILLLCLCPLLAYAETTGTPNGRTTAEINHAIYEANQLDALFSRHESGTFTFTYAFKPENDSVIWETPKGCFQTWRDGTAQYIKEHVMYSLFPEDQPEETELSCTCVYGEPYRYCYVAEPEEAFYSPEHERDLGCFEEDGLLTLISEFDESLSREFIEAEGQTYSGEIVRSKMTVDAKNYDILDYRLSIPEDGNEKTIVSIQATYDEPEPLAGRLLKSAFEHASRNMMNVTYIFDPGTDHEAVSTITVPTNTECRIYGLDVPFAFFDDPDCTTITSWDMLSDHTFYVITNPSDEINERFQKAQDAASQKSASADSESTEK